jgi:membrane protease YdiL (CAAX protease family)
VVHLCHHGLLLTAGGFTLRPLSGAVWVALMFLTALLFAYLRKRSGSLMPAIVAHAGFNLVMNLTIFGFLWKSSL